MKIAELKKLIGKYPDDFDVVIDVSSEYEDYDVVTSVVPVKYGRFRCGNVDYNDIPNAVILK